MRSLKCFFGHQFGVWKYVTDDSCRQVRVCRRDEFTEQRIQHNFGEWKYVADGSCEQVRVCLRDGLTEQRYPHIWQLSDTAYHQCRRCGQKEPHDWKHTTTEHEEAAERVRGGGGWKTKYVTYESDICSNCGMETEEKEISRRENISPWPP